MKGRKYLEQTKEINVKEKIKRKKYFKKRNFLENDFLNDKSMKGDVFLYEHKL